MSGYSEKELQMFKELGKAELLKYISCTRLYSIAVQDAFLNNMTGKAVESLRRTAIHVLSTPTIFRLTPEFDDLIDL